MIVNEVNYLNLDTLYGIVVDKSNNDYYKSLKFGRTYTDLLNHTSITFQLKNVTMYEYLFLNKFSSSITHFDTNGMDIDFIKETYPELDEKCISSYVSFSSTVGTELGKDYMSFFSPSGFLTGSCIINLTGIELRNFIGFDLDNFFKLASKGKCCKEDESFDISYKDLIYEDEDFNNYIISTFLNGFYKYLLDSSLYKSNDILSDSYNYKNFVSNVADNGIQLSTIRNPLFNVDFINDSYDNVISIFNSYKENNVDTDFTFNNTYLEFNLSTPFNTLFDLFSILPKNRIISIESFGIPENNFYNNSDNSSYECPEELLDNYENRFYGRLNSLYSNISDVYSDNKYILKRLELIPNNTLVKYSIIVSFSDISYILNNYLEDSSNDYRLSSIKTNYYINSIINLSKTIYTSLK